MIDLTRMINPLGVSKEVIVNFRLHLYKVNEYSPPSDKLIEKIAKINNAHKDKVIITDGADGALTLIAQSIFKGKKVIIPQPCFYRYKDYPSYLGVEYKLIKPRNSIFINEEEVLKSEGKILLIASPNNPTGFVIPDTFLKKALKKFETVILDETLLISVKGKEELLNQHPNLIIVRSFSKLFGLAGMRIGYVLSSIENIQRIKDVSTPYKVNYLGQIAALSVLSDTDYITKTRALFQQEREKLYKALKNINIKLSESFCYCLPLTEKQLQHLSEKGIIIEKDMEFISEGDKLFRLSISTPENNDKLISAIRGEENE